MPTTAENLKTAFAGESQANRKYLAYANKADKEGYPRFATPRHGTEVCGRATASKSSADGFRLTLTQSSRRALKMR